MRAGLRALNNAFEAILEQRQDEVSPRMRGVLTGLRDDWRWLDQRIDQVSDEIKEVRRSEESCARIMSIPGIGPMISTAPVAAIGKREVFDRGRDFAAWVGLVPQQFSTGGRTILGRITINLKVRVYERLGVEAKCALAFMPCNRISETEEFSIIASALAGRKSR